MVFQEPDFHAFRRRRLAARLQAPAIHPHLPRLPKEELAARERWLFSEGLELYFPVLRTVLRTLAREVERGIIEPGELDQEELAFVTFRRAIEDIRRLPALPRDRFARLCHLVRDTVHQAAVARHSARHGAPASPPPSEAETQLEQPSGRVDPERGRWREALNHPNLPVPEDLITDTTVRSIGCSTVSANHDERSISSLRSIGGRTNASRPWSAPYPTKSARSLERALASSAAGSTS